MNIHNKQTGPTILSKLKIVVTILFFMLIRKIMMCYDEDVEIDKIRMINTIYC